MTWGLRIGTRTIAMRGGAVAAASAAYGWFGGGGWVTTDLIDSIGGAGGSASLAFPMRG